MVAEVEPGDVRALRGVIGHSNRHWKVEAGVIESGASQPHADLREPDEFGRPGPDGGRDGTVCMTATQLSR